MSKHILVDYHPTRPTTPSDTSYVVPVMQPERPRFNPYVIRREGRLLLSIPGDDQRPVRTIELDAVELTRLLVGAHEALSGYLRQVQGEAP